MTTSLHTCSVFCPRCQTAHTLPTGSAKKAALDLINQLDVERRLDFHLPPERSDPRFATEYLFGEARGKMFGVLVCLRADGRITTLKSFSGQYNGEWDIEGWAPPLFDLRQWHIVNDDTEKAIKKIGAAIEQLGTATPRGRELIRQRRTMSQDLMKALHRLYTLHNFNDERRPLVEVYKGENGIPNGTADCCGPKLLNFAARSNLRPISLAEFYYGRQNRQGNRVHRRFYPPCQDKCAPILGYMLCGIDPVASPQQ